MSTSTTSVTIRADLSKLRAALARTAVDGERMGWRMRWLFASPAQRHRMRHHRKENPTRSAIHAEYDRRRRARRRRNRR